jgi:hypothetical protein
LGSKRGMRILRRGDRRRGENNVGKVISNTDNPLSFTFVARKEFKKILKLARILVLKESLGTTGFAWVPTELRSSSVILWLLANDKCVPSLVDQRLMQKTINNTRMHPVALCHARLEMPCHVLDVTLAGRMQRGAKATGPVLPLTQELDDLFGVRARLTAVALFVVLVE